MFTVQYWYDNWTEGDKPHQFSRESLEEARKRLVYYLDFDPDIAVLVYKDNTRLLVSAFLDGQEVAA